MNPEQQEMFGIRVLSVNVIDGKYNLLVEWKDPNGEFYLILHEEMRFLSNIIFPEKIIEKALKEHKERAGKGSFPVVWRPVV